MLMLATEGTPSQYNVRLILSLLADLFQRLYDYSLAISAYHELVDTKLVHKHAQLFAL